MAKVYEIFWFWTANPHSADLYIFRLNSIDVGVSFEIFGVEGQQIFDVVRIHTRQRFWHRGLERLGRNDWPRVRASFYKRRVCRARSRKIFQIFLVANLFLRLKSQVRFYPLDECKHSKIRRHFAIKHKKYYFADAVFWVLRLLFCDAGDLSQQGVREYLYQADIS